MKTIVVLSIICWEYFVIANTKDLENGGNTTYMLDDCVGDNCVSPHTSVKRDNETIVEVEFRRHKRRRITVKSVKQFIAADANKKKEATNTFVKDTNTKISKIAKKNVKSFNNIAKMSTKELVEEMTTITQMNALSMDAFNTMFKIGNTSAYSLHDLIDKASQNILESSDSYANTFISYSKANLKNVKTIEEAKQFVNRVDEIMSFSDVHLKDLSLSEKNKINEMINNCGCKVIELGNNHIGKLKTFESKEYETQKLIKSFKFSLYDVPQYIDTILKKIAQHCFIGFDNMTNKLLETFLYIKIEIKKLYQNICTLNDIIIQIQIYLDGRQKSNRQIYIDFVHSVGKEKEKVTASIKNHINAQDTCKIPKACPCFH